MPMLPQIQLCAFSVAKKGILLEIARQGHLEPERESPQMARNQLGTLHLQPREEPRALKVTLRVRSLGENPKKGKRGLGACS